MDTEEGSKNFATEWQRLKEERRKLVQDEEGLTQRLISLPQERDMNRLLIEKRKLKGQISRMTFESSRMNHNLEIRIASGRKRIEERKRALTDEKLRWSHSAVLRKKRAQLAKLEKKNASADVVREVSRSIFDLSAPIAELETLYQQMAVKAEKVRADAVRVLDKTTRRLALIDENYRKAKHCLQAEIREVERERDGCRPREIEWATQSREHIEWILEHEPTYKEDVLRRYKERFPEESLDAYLPAVQLSPSPTQNNEQGKKTKTRPAVPVALPQSAVVEVKPEPPPWRFWITFSPSDPGVELLGSREQFIDTLRATLEKHSCPISPAFIYDKLRLMIKWEPWQRKVIKIIRAPEHAFLGWKIYKPTPCVRLFLLIHEGRREIRFTATQRKDAY